MAIGFVLFVLTPSVLEAEIGEPPDISQPHRVRDARHGKVELRPPRASLGRRARHIGAVITASAADDDDSRVGLEHALVLAIAAAAVGHAGAAGGGGRGAVGAAVAAGLAQDEVERLAQRALVRDHHGGTMDVRSGIYVYSSEKSSQNHDGGAREIDRTGRVPRKDREGAIGRRSLW